jgi:hypothetical protein
MRIAAHTQLISRHRLARLAHWAKLWLLRACAWMLREEARPDLTHRVTHMRRVVRALLLLSAAHAIGGRFGAEGARAAPSAPWAMRGKSKRRARALRCVVGGHVRRALKGRGLSGQIGALLQILHRPARLIARLRKRLARGMTRFLSPAPFAPPAPAPRPALQPPAPLPADSS